jgi:hypothetical protein
MIRDAFDRAMTHRTMSCPAAESHQQGIYVLYPSEHAVLMTTVVVTPPTLVSISVKTSDITRVYDTTTQFTPILLDTRRSVVSVEGPTVPLCTIFRANAQGPE